MYLLGTMYIINDLTGDIGDRVAMYDIVTQFFLNNSHDFNKILKRRIANFTAH